MLEYWSDLLFTTFIDNGLQNGHNCNIIHFFSNKLIIVYVSTRTIRALQYVIYRANTSYTGVGGRKTKIFRRKNHQQQQQQQQLYRSNSAVTKIWPHFVIQR